MTPTFVDTHAHLGMLAHSPLEEILSRAAAAGIGKMVTVSTGEENWETNQKIAEAHPHISFTVGLHPHDAKDWPRCAQSITRFATKPAKLVAIGEMGLDFHYDLSPRELQIEAFEAQLRLAKAWDLPVVVHCRDAFKALFASVRNVGLGTRGGVMHCFTGTKEEAKGSLDLGFKISFSGIVTFKTAETLREAARAVPADALLVETDCPFLAPVPYRGKPNEPSYLPSTAEVLAKARSERIESIAELTTRNAIAFFRL